MKKKLPGTAPAAALLPALILLLLVLCACGARTGTSASTLQRAPAATADDSAARNTPVPPKQSAPITSVPTDAPASTDAPTSTSVPTSTDTPNAPASAGTPTPTDAAEPADEELVRVLDYIPSLYVELKYAGEDNFTGSVIYDFTDALLRYGTVKKLAAVQDQLLTLGFSLKIWDAYRPAAAQFVLWSVCPDPAYVANPGTGFSSHSRGSTVDVTLTAADGTELEMPTGFDDFSPLADRDYSDVISQAAKEHALLLEELMYANGFAGYSGEWWHYSDSVAYPVITD